MFHNRQPRYIQKYTQHNVVFDQFKETTRFCLCTDSDTRLCIILDRGNQNNLIIKPH